MNGHFKGLGVSLCKVFNRWEKLPQGRKGMVGRAY